jgi:hypothetical protein
MDNYSEYNDEIRVPDQVINEQLTKDTRSEFQKQMDEAMYISLQEIKACEDSNKKYETDLIQQYVEETNKRKEIFATFLLDMNKLLKFDKEVREIYEIVEPIIESYCNQYFEICDLDEETYKKIFNLLGKIRVNKVGLEILKTIILNGN